jgi:hypothetical protein
MEDSMNEVKRGAPTEDGTYNVLFSDGWETVFRLKGGNFYHTGSGYSSRSLSEVVAHRKHEPIVVPELKDMEFDVGYRKTVIRSHFTGRVLGAFLDHAGYAFSVANNRCYRKCAFEPGEFTELTKAECEQAGYRWPF